VATPVSRKPGAGGTGSVPKGMPAPRTGGGTKPASRNMHAAGQKGGGGTTTNATGRYRPLPPQPMPGGTGTGARSKTTGRRPSVDVIRVGQPGTKVTGRMHALTQGKGKKKGLRRITATVRAATVTKRPAPKRYARHGSVSAMGEGGK